MNADHFSLKARRTTRIPLRIPVLLVIDEQGKSRSLDGWTMIVNIHGAKIECKHRFGMHEEVLVQVPFNSMSQKGKIVWSRSEPNDNGNYEIGVELDRPENLWGVGFPPSDWENARRGKESAAVAAILDLALKDAIVPPPEESPTPSASDAAQQEVSPAAPGVPAVATEVYFSAPAQLSQILDLSEEVCHWDSHRQDAESGDLPTAPADPCEPPPNPISSQEDQTPMAVAEPALGTSLSLQETRAVLAGSLPNARAAAGPPARAELGSSAPFVGGNPTDRLSAIFNELVDSALHAKVLGLVEELGTRIEARAAQIESAALARAEQRIQATVLEQSQSLEQHATEFTAAQQETLKQNIQRFVGASEAEVRERQEQFVGLSQSALQTELDQLVRYGKERLEQQTTDLLFATEKGLRASMEQQLPAIEKDLLERCLKQAETLMAGQVEQWTLLHSDRMQESHQAAEQKLNQASEQIAAQHAAALEAKLAEVASQSSARLEQQLGRIGTQVRQAFLRHIVTELGRSQQVWVQQSQRQIEQMAADSIEKTRLSLSQMMKNLGESLIQQAIPPAPGPEPATPQVQSAESPDAHLSKMSLGSGQ
jgi:hypothetical protein